MPTYVFECTKCKVRFQEMMLKYDETGKYKGVKCPACGSSRKKQMPTTCACVMFGNPRGTSKGDSDTYVYGYNMDQAQDERRNAEENSHMGTDIFPEFQQDIDSGNYDAPE